MIVHVYNPERTLSNNGNNTNNTIKVANNIKSSCSSSAVNKHASNVARDDPNVNRPPPSPKLLRQSGFKGFYSKLFQSSHSNENQSTFESRCLGVKKQNHVSRETKRQQMDREPDMMWANRSHPQQQQQQQQHQLHRQLHHHTPSPSSGAVPQQGCTCQCGVAGSAEPANRATPGQRDSSAASSHYFTPVSSFGCDESKEPDSLEYRPVRDSPPVRKASLDRILSPSASRRPMTSSPHQASGAPASLSTPGSKPISPVSSTSNNNTHSSFSEDSLLVQSGYHHHHESSVHHKYHHHHHQTQQYHHHHGASPFTSPTSTPSLVQRWNNLSPYEPLSGNWNAVQPAEAEKQRPANQQSLDFSKDSLNSPDKKLPELLASQGKTAVDLEDEGEEEEEEEESSSSYSEAVRLESLAFTIDFGDATSVKAKKKETPKRFVERLANASSHSSKRSTSALKSLDSKKKPSESGTPGTADNPAKMLKSLTASAGRLGGPLSSPLAKYGDSVATAKQVEVEPADAPRRPAPLAKAKGGSTGSRHSSIGRTPAYPSKAGTRRDHHQILTRRSPSPTPPPSPVKKYNNNNSSSSRKQLSIESDDGCGGGYEDDRGVSVVAEPSSALAADSETAAETTEYDEDAASETGTYTIGKDSPSVEEDQSRRDIERVFGLLPSVATDNAAPEDRSTPHWIREWAAQVAQQQQQQETATARLSKPPSHPKTQPEQQQQQQRPRRRLPSVPPTASNASSRSRSSPRPSDMSDPSDSSLETECFLRDTESVVCAMQARVDGRSSADSDAETRSSASYRAATSDLENSIGRKLSAQLRAKIRSLDEQYSAQSPASGSMTVARKTTYVVSNNAPNAPSSIGSVSQSVTTNVIHNELHADDAKSLRSDSSLSDVTSSDALSRRMPVEDHKPANSAPAVRYNRALSLRRGRLGLDVEPNAAIGAASSNATSSTATTSSSAKERRSWTNNSEPPSSRGTSPHVPPSPGPPVTATRKLSTASSAQSQMSTASTPGKSASSSFSRTDGGRYSLRVGSKSSTPTPSSVYKAPKVSKSHSGNVREQHSAAATAPPPPAASSGAAARKSNSSLTSKEAEFQNWKRRKNYDPMKAAAEGKKKEAARRAATLTMSQSMIGTVATSMIGTPSSQSPSPPPRAMVRSASFTCVNNASKARPVDMAEQCAQQQYNNNSRRSSHHKTGSVLNSPLLYSSDDEHEMLYSPPKKASPKPSPSTGRKYMGLNLLHNSPPSLPPNDFTDLASVASNDVDLTASPGSPRRKMYVEDGCALSRGSASNSSLRARTKLEALDNLVISTIYGLSSKIRVNAESLMRKLRPQHVDDMERLAMIEDTLNRLSECSSESPVASGRSSSRELSGTLKVMKRIEQVFQVLDQVLFEEVMDGAGEEGATLNDGTTTEGEDWNGGYTSGDFY